jgi:hypothetical protein
MKGREHFGLPVSRRGNMVGGSERANRVGARVLVVEPDEITGVEVDYSISWSRSSQSRGWNRFRREGIPVGQEMRA